MSISLSTRIRVAPDAVSRTVAGEALIVDMKSGHYFGLDAVGTRAWELIGHGGTLENVLDSMLEEFEVERERLEVDLRRLAEELLARGLVVGVDSLD